MTTVSMMATPSISKRLHVSKAAIVAVVALMLFACAGNETPTATRTPQPVPISTIPLASNKNILDEIWSTVDDYYIFGEANTEQWLAVRTEYLARVTDAMSEDEFAEIVGQMIAELPEGAASWVSRAERIEQDITDLSSYEGIGALVAYRAEPRPRVIILSTMPDSPAERAGLNAHDSLVGVDGVPVTTEEGADVINRVRGPAGGDVTLSVRSPGGEEREVVVTRGQIATSDAVGYNVTPDREIGYILMPPLVYEGIDQQVLSVLQSLAGEDNQLKGMILDLRIARGGNWPLEMMTTVFNNGELGEVYTREQVLPFTVEGQDVANSQALPLVILVGQDTSGGAEIFAALMQASGRAQLLGQTTLGNIEGASSFELSDGSRLVVSTSSYRTADGRDIGLTGVVPDRVIDMDWDEVSFSDDPIRDEAERMLRQ